MIVVNKYSETLRKETSPSHIETNC